jgi:radical SAM superfamily enzyme YgiQ (UPF0313 family)
MILFDDNLKVGIYIAKDHLWFKTYKESSIPFGLKAVISELDASKYYASFCHINTVNDFDFLFYSVNSAIDYLVLIRDFSKIKNRKFKLIVGGSDLINIHLLREVVDIAVIGRAEGQINEILKGASFDNVWRREEDIGLSKRYKVRQPQYLLRVGTRIENNVGCKMACAFCQYGHKFKQFIKSQGYDSSFSGLETMFRDINWELARLRVTSSIDGSTEFTRHKLGKPLSDEEIIQKLAEVESVEYGKTLILKLYNIMGFPWENEASARLWELKDVFRQAEGLIHKTKLRINFQINHFVPMLLTRFESYPVSLIDFRNESSDKPIFDGKHIQVILWRGSISRINSLDETYIHRSFEIDQHIYEMSKSKYFRLEPDKRFDWYISRSTLHQEVTKLPSEIYG